MIFFLETTKTLNMLGQLTTILGLAALVSGACVVEEQENNFLASRWILYLKCIHFLIQFLLDWRATGPLTPRCLSC